MTAAPRPFQWQRFTLHLGALVLCSALGGLITTVAVAWGLAAWLPHRSFYWVSSLALPTAHGREVHVDSFSRAGMIRREWFMWDLSGNRQGTMLPTPFGPRSVKATGEIDLGWGLLPLSIAGTPESPTGGTEDARGWPLVALWCELHTSWSSGVETVSATGGVRASSSTRFGDFRALPYRPIYRGLLIDTAAFAPAWAVLFALVRFRPLRRTLRRRRHQCPACGYDLRGLAGGVACPECGARA